MVKGSVQSGIQFDGRHNVPIAVACPPEIGRPYYRCSTLHRNHKPRLEEEGEYRVRSDKRSCPYSEVRILHSMVYRRVFCNELPDLVESLPWHNPRYDHLSCWHWDM